MSSRATSNTPITTPGCDHPEAPDPVVGTKRPQRAATVYRVIRTVKRNGSDPQAWCADISAGISDRPVPCVPPPLPWRCPPDASVKAA